MTSLGSRAYKLAVVLVTAIAMASALIGPTEAGPRRWPNLMVSTDNRHWAAELKNPLFDKRMLWVPGDQVLRRVYIRNMNRDAGYLTISITTADRGRVLRSRQLRLDVKANRQWFHVAKPGHRQIVRVRMPGKAVRWIWVRVTLLPTARNNTMRQKVPFDLHLRLTSTR